MQYKFNWDCASLLLIVIYLVFAFLRLILFPAGLDIYYHLGVMQGFDLAGGIVTWDFWEFAPLGRPHFYPPILHILMLLFYKLGFSKISIINLFGFLTFPLFMFTFWLIVKKIFNPRLAFFVVLMCLVSYSLFIGLSNALAGTLAMIILWGLFFSFEKNKKLSIIVLTALLFYSHYAISLMGILSFVLYLILRREEKLKEKALLLLGGMVLALPWLVNFVSNFGYLRQSIYYDLALEINIILLFLSLPGIFLCLKFGKSHLFFSSLLLVALLGSLNHPYRFFSTQGAVGMVFASAVVLERFFSWVASKKIIHVAVLAILFIFGLNLLSFSMVLTPLSKEMFVQDALLWNLFIFPLQNPGVHSFRDICFYRKYGDEFKKVVDIINTYTEKGDIIYSNFSYQATIFSAFTQRANATMSPYTLESGLPQEKHIRNARLILWLKNIHGKIEDELVRYVETLKLEEITETEMFYVYRNPSVNLKMKIAQPIVPSQIAFLLIFVSSGLTIWDLLRPEHYTAPR